MADFIIHLQDKPDGGVIIDVKPNPRDLANTSEAAAMCLQIENALKAMHRARITCPRCGGQKKVKQDPTLTQQGMMAHGTNHPVPCPMCKGKGYVDKAPVTGSAETGNSSTTKGEDSHAGDGPYPIDKYRR